MSETGRTVSIVAPCRNERDFVGGFLASAFAQQLPPGWQLQVVVADGMSDDGTREALKAAAGDARLVVVDNPGRIVSTGLNRALEAATGEVVVRMDLHTDYASDYVARCLEALAETGADNVGGPWHAELAAAARPMQRAVAAAFQSRWVAGGALSRRLDYSGWVDTVYLGAWPRGSFTRFGGFDEALVRNQDDEHNLRIVRGGGRIWQSARIRSRYRPRASLGQVFRQYLQYGYWKPFVMRKHGQAASMRQLVPGVFVAALVATSVAAAIDARPLLALVAAYAVAVLAMTAAVAAGGSLGAGALLRVPVVIAAYHVSYGLGSLCGAWDALRGRPPRPRFGMLTR